MNKIIYHKNVQRFLAIFFVSILIFSSSNKIFSFKADFIPVAHAAAVNQSASQRKASLNNSCSALNWTSGNALNCALLKILYLDGKIIQASATLFEWVIEPKTMMTIIDNPIIYSTWALVRDTLNILFILVLLFSAFATVFQVDKYSYKKILLTLVIMALLVNFSFPISRFIIDVANSMMYYLINNLGGGAGSFAQIANSGGLLNIIHPADMPDLTNLISAIIFGFIFAITLMIIAVLFLIRSIALAILIIFSSVAFIGAIAPFSASYADKWWDKLFEYAFFGPIMIFMIYVSVEFMNKISTSANGTMKAIAANQSLDSSFVSSIAFFMIPLVILWIGIGMAQSFNIAGAKKVTDKAHKYARVALNAPWQATGIPGGFKKAKDHYIRKGAPGFLGKIPGLRGDEKTKSTEAWIAGKLGVTGSQEQDIKKRASEMDKSNESVESLREQARSGNIAAIYRLSEMGIIEKEEFTIAMNKTRDQKVREMLENTTRKKRADVVVDSKIQQAEQRAGHNLTEAERINIAQNEIGKLSTDQWKNQNMEKLLGYDRESQSYSIDANTIARRQATENYYQNSNAQRRQTMVRDMNGNNYAASSGVGII